MDGKALLQALYEASKVTGRGKSALEQGFTRFLRSTEGHVTVSKH